MDKNYRTKLIVFTVTFLIMTIDEIAQIIVKIYQHNKI